VAGQDTSGNIIDCLIVGGGPAGLTAATYLGRYRRSVMLIDDGQSRARLIPESHNYPGYTGISGPDLLKLLRQQASHYGARLEHGRIETLRRESGELLIAETAGGIIRTRSVLLATGVVDKDPPLDGVRIALRKGTLRYCPICDGYEAMDKRIGIFGPVRSGCKKALFLRTYSADVTLLLTQEPTAADAELLQAVRDAGVHISNLFAFDLEEDGDEITARFADGTLHAFDVIYPALGCDIRSDLARNLGADCDDDGAIVTDLRQRSTIPGIFAAGDVVSDLDQLSVAVGHAAIASTAIHNSLPRNFR
jgi:thioredoxin reductase (NADPH)